MLSSCYLLGQGSQLLAYQRRAEPVSELLASGTWDSGTPIDADVRSFLVEVAEIRSFAAGTLGLNESENYTSIVPTSREHLADVVSAVDELSFSRHEWWWPFVGRLPYKGYYDPAGAERLAERLRNRGLDVWVRPVDAFSTLGVLRDPLYEFMTSYDRYTIANLIIHELAHSTLFLRGHAQFNEEFATFVGDAGARAYLVARGADPAELEAVTAREHDRDTLRALIFALRDELETIYASARSLEAKRAAKAETIGRWQDELRGNAAGIFANPAYAAVADIPINNAYIDLYVKYTQDLELFAALFEEKGESIRGLVDALGVLGHPRAIEDRDARRLARRDPKAYMREYLLFAAALDSAEAASVE
jgi:predicted aminopeptidase